MAEQQLLCGLRIVWEIGCKPQHLGHQLFLLSPDHGTWVVLTPDRPALDRYGSTFLLSFLGVLLAPTVVLNEPTGSQEAGAAPEEKVDDVLGRLEPDQILFRYDDDFPTRSKLGGDDLLRSGQIVTVASDAEARHQDAEAGITTFQLAPENGQRRRGDRILGVLALDEDERFEYLETVSKSFVEEDEVDLLVAMHVEYVFMGQFDPRDAPEDV